MRVLVTGGAGFLGSSVCQLFAEQGNRVVAFDNFTKHELNRTGYDVAAARDHVVGFLRKFRVKVVRGDVRNEKALLAASKGCDYIVHTAAQPAMTISIENPRLDLTTNVVGTFNVLETARQRDLPVAICSTIHVYGNKINETLYEGDETRFCRLADFPSAIAEDNSTMEGSITPLHASKRTGEIYAQAFMDTYGLRVAVFRLTGIYGPRQFGAEDHGWVANFVIKTLLGEEITLFGTGKQVRDILYVEDAAKAFNAVGASGIYNIGGGPDTAISLIECIQLIERVTGKKARIKYAPKRQGDLWWFISDTGKAREELGWESQTRCRQGIEQLVAWAQKNISIFQGVRT